MMQGAMPGATHADYAHDLSDPNHKGGSRYSGRAKNADH
jgi:hypothetical protein